MPLVDGKAVDKRDADQPRQKRHVFDGVPAPVAAPAQDHVRPHGPQSDAERQKHPRRQGKALAAKHPSAVAPANDAGGDRVGKRHRQTRIAQEEHRRVNGHRPMLQQAVHAKQLRGGGERAVGVEVDRVRRRERRILRREQHNPHEGDEHELNDEHGDIVERLSLCHAAHSHQRPEQSDEPCPEQQRALAPRPQAAHPVEHAPGAGAAHVVVEHVLDPYVIREEAPHQHGARDAQAGKGDERRDAAAPAQRFSHGLFPQRVSAGQANNADARPDKRREQANHSNQDHVERVPFLVRTAVARRLFSRAPSPRDPP